MNLDVVLFGGGIAGLWSLARLQQQGYRALLFEHQALGQGQSMAAQGIIHGGSKYSLTRNSRTVAALQQMPDVWRTCCAGTGILDLRGVRCCSTQQYLWTAPQRLASLSGRLAQHLIRSRIHRVSPADYPTAFRHPAFHGPLYQLEEPVLDTHSLISTLAKQLAAHIYHLPHLPEIQYRHGRWHIHLPAGQCLNSHSLVLAAGAGNEGLLHQLGRTLPRMQRRPLHMLMLRGLLPDLYAHYLAGGVTPALTITSQSIAGDAVVWYLGGEVAETGITRTPGEQIAVGQAVLQQALPWLKLARMDWASLRIDRAEPQTEHRQRPGDVWLHAASGLYTVWPTKLALAPRLAEQLLAQLPPPAGYPAPLPLALPHPPIAHPIWQAVTWKTVS